MRSPWLRFTAVVILALATSGAPIAQNSAATSGTGPTLQFMGPLTFGPDDTLFAADAQDVSIYALKLGKALQGSAPGTKNVANIDRQLAALAGTDAANITITDMKVSPTSHNTFISVMRGQGAAAKPMLVRVDGAGNLDVVPLDKLSYTKLKLDSPDKITSLKIGQRGLRVPNYLTGEAGRRDGPVRHQTVTDMAFVDGRLTSPASRNEEFASRLRSILSVRTADKGTGSGSHTARTASSKRAHRSTRSCRIRSTARRTDRVVSLHAGQDRLPRSARRRHPRRTIAGVRQREPPAGHDRVEGRTGLILMSNSRRGVMKVSTAGFASARRSQANEREGIDDQARGDSVAQGVEQLDLLNATHALLLVR